jgi:hypothetical protein
LQVYALTKERDALRKGSEKIADYSALIKEKDGIIKQVCVCVSVCVCV